MSDIRNQIQEVIDSNAVVLFMKGEPKHANVWFFWICVPSTTIA